jgi:predicted dehydrogenase
MEANGQALGVLVVGVGFLGARRAAAVSAARHTRLIAVCDRDEDRAHAIAQHLGVLDSNDYAEAVANPDVDAVAVATPHADHVHQVRLALQAGKHVLCEKPLAIDPSQARELATLADERGLRLATGLNHRFYPPVRDALSLVASRVLGRVEIVNAVIGHNATRDFLTSWHTDVTRSGGGTLIDNGPHACDLIRSFLGEVTAASGVLEFPSDAAGTCEVEAFAHFVGREGGTAELRSSWILENGYLTIDVLGTSGRLRIETAPWRLSVRLSNGRQIQKRYVADRLRERFFQLRYGCERSLVWEVDEFAGSVGSSQQRRGASGWDGCRATDMIAAVYRSACMGEEVALKPLPVHLPGARKRIASRERT